MTLCQDAPQSTCRVVYGLPGCDCDLCKRLASGRWWHCVACDCVPCSVAREVEGLVYGRAHRPAVDVVMHGDGGAAVVVGERVWIVPAVDVAIDWDAVATVGG